MKTFSQWLLTYERDNRIGDLAGDVRRDPPSGDWGYQEMLAHMLERRACKEAWQSAKAAFTAYVRYVAKTTQSE